MILINRFIIYPLTIGHCLTLKKYDLDKLVDNDLERDYLILSVVSNVTDLHTIANHYRYLAIEEFSRIRSTCVTIKHTVDYFQYDQLYQLIFNLNGNTFQSYEGVLSIPLSHISTLNDVIQKYNDKLNNR